MSDVENKVREFYDNYGWVSKDGKSGEDKSFREFTRPYYPYHEGVNARTLKCFSNLTGSILMAGGGDLPETHVQIVKKFSECTFIDISEKALEIAGNKLDQKGEYVNASILEIPKSENQYDAAYCAHVIYHIDRSNQEKAVRELIRVTKPGGRIVILYRNPNSLAARLIKIKKNIMAIAKLKKLRQKIRGNNNSIETNNIKSKQTLYFFAFPLDWWDQFKNECDINFLPWDVMSCEEENKILTNSVVAKLGYKYFSWFENKYPKTAVKWWSYPIVELTKR